MRDNRKGSEEKSATIATQLRCRIKYNENKNTEVYMKI